MQVTSSDPSVVTAVANADSLEESHADVKSEIENGRFRKTDEYVQREDAKEIRYHGDSPQRI